MKQRWLLSIFSVLALLYYALPRLPFNASGMPQYFSLLWLMFALLAIGGNLAAFLYAESKQISVLDLTKEEHERERSYDAQIALSCIHLYNVNNDTDEWDEEYEQTNDEARTNFSIY